MKQQRIARQRRLEYLLAVHTLFAFTLPVLSAIYYVDAANISPSSPFTNRPTAADTNLTNWRELKTWCARNGFLAGTFTICGIFKGEERGQSAKNSLL